MKKFLKLFLLLSLVLAFSSCSSNTTSIPTKDKPVVWKLSHFQTEDHNWHMVSEEFAKNVEKETEGKVKIEIYPNSQLGGEMEALNGILSKTVDMTITAETMANWAPIADLMAAPYAYSSAEHIQKVLDSKIGDKLKSELTEAGFKPLFHQYRTPRNLTSNKPVHNPKEAKGIKIRVPNSPLSMDCWQSVGANVNVMSLGEVFTALNQGVIDAQENPADMIYSQSFYNVQKYVNETEHVRGYLFYVVGTEQFNSLDEETQNQILKAAEETQKYADKLYFDTENEFMDKLAEKGMTIVSDVDRDAFRETMIPAIKKYFEKQGHKELFEMYEEIVKMGE